MQWSIHADCALMEENNENRRQFVEKDVIEAAMRAVRKYPDVFVGWMR